jgi:diguanylate cyclase (GGDEF)-like protein
MDGAAIDSDSGATSSVTGFPTFGEATRAAIAVVEARVPARVVFIGRGAGSPAELTIVDVDAEERLAIEDTPPALDPSFLAELAASRAAVGSNEAPPSAHSVIQIPLALTDGSAAGALCALPRLGERLAGEDIELLEVTARLLARELERGQRERELERLNRKLRQQTHDLAELERVGRELARTPDFRRSLCETARGVADAPMAALYEVSKDGTLAPGASAGHSGGGLAKLDEHLVAAEAFERGERVIASSSPRYAEVYNDMSILYGVETVLAEPMPADGVTVGVLVISWRERYSELSERTQSVVSLLAREAALVLVQRQTVKDLRELARTDDLTGLPNRRAWQEQFTRELARAHRGGGSVSIALLDLDHFKAYNDERGHEAGDRLLKEAGATWRSELRATDLLARWGGEEFALLLVDSSPADAERAVERVRRATPSGSTCSAGIAHWDGSELGAALLQRADEALYSAKAAGRDRTAVAPGVP